MLVETMTDKEQHEEIFNDFYKLEESTIPRLVAEYSQVRKKLRIAPDREYAVCREVKTNKKNPWLIFISKPPSHSHYKGDVNYQAMTYYNTPKGLRVFKVNPEQTGGISCYNAHLFKRYAERLKLDLNTTLDKVKHFFINNGYGKGRIIAKEDGREYSIMVYRDGMTLGELQNDGFWFVHKTFISANEKRADQTEIESELIESLKAEIEQVFLAGDAGGNLEFMKDVLLGMTKK